MAHTLSAKKRMRQDKKRHARNQWRKGKIKDVVKKFDLAIHDEKFDEAEGLLPEVYKQLDKVAAKGTIHKNAAARKKARLTKRLAAAKAKHK